MKMEICPGCGVELAVVDGPVHRYMTSTPSCWALYGQLLSREYSDPAYMAVHRLSVDSYAVQHPGTPSPQSIQSVAVHLISLYAVLELDLAHALATALIKRCAEAMTFDWLEPPASRGSTTVSDVLAADTAARHVELVRAWAVDAWQAWSIHHEQIRRWARVVQTA